MPERVRLFLVQTPIQAMLAGLGGLLVAWPILQIAGERGTEALFVYVFVVWAALVGLLLAVGRCIARVAELEAGEGEARHGGRR